MGGGPGGNASEVGFFGLKVPGKGFALQALSEDDPVVELIHVTSVALGEKPADGPHVVKISVGEAKDIVLGTLHKERCSQFSVDLIIEASARVDNSGGSAVYLSGYRTLTLPDDFFDDDDDDEMYSSDGSEEDDDEAPQAVPIPKGDKKSRNRLIDEAASEDDEDEDGDSDDEGEDDEDEEDEGGSGDLRMDSDDMVAEFESDDEGSEGSEESSEEAPPLQAKSGAKRPAEAKATPQPAKKLKAEAAKAPASAPPKAAANGKAPATPAAAKTPAAKTPAKLDAKTPAKPDAKTPASSASDDKAYEAALLGFLKAQAGPTKIAALGSAVKKPNSAIKMQKFLTDRPGLFKFDVKNQVVEAAAKK